MFGELVRAHRQRLGQSQAELAERAAVSERAIRKIESGAIEEPRPATVRLLADAFGLTGSERDRFCLRARPGSADTAGGWLAPAQLPADVAAFTGRTAALTQLSTVLDRARSATPPPVVITAIGGMPGVGKTAVALHWAHLVRHQFPDGQLYANLRGYDPAGAALRPGQVLRSFLEALAVPGARIPATVEGQAALYRSTLASRRMLVVLDNAGSSDQVRPLLPASPGSLAIVTSRRRLAGLVAAEGAYPLPLDLLSPDEARDMLRLRIGADRVAAEPEAVDQIIDRCARLPLALALAAALAAFDTGLPLWTLAERLGGRAGRLEVLAGEGAGTDLRAVFATSDRTLSPAAARLFRLLGLHPAVDVPTSAAASLAGLAESGLQPLLAELVRAHLVAQPEPDRYALHDLVRVYAAECCVQTIGPAPRKAAVRRLLDYYLRAAHAADHLIFPNREPIALPPKARGVGHEPLASAADAMRWFGRNRLAIAAAVELAVRHGFDRHAWQLAWSVATFEDRQGNWEDTIVLMTAAIPAARRAIDPPGLAGGHRFLARAYLRLGRLSEARQELERAVEVAAEAGDGPGEGHAELVLGQLDARQGDHRAALAHAHRALGLYPAEHPSRARALNGVGWYSALLGQYEQAVGYCRQALPLLRQHGERGGEADTWDSLGYAYQHLGDCDEAVRCYRRAIDLYHQLSDRFYQAGSLARLGNTYRAADAADQAIRAWHEALAIYEELGHPDADLIRAKLSDARP